MAKNLIKLVAPEGATSVHFEGEDYDVVDGNIDVPVGAVEQLTGAHGYMLPCAEEAASPSVPAAPDAGDTGNNPPDANTSTPAALNKGPTPPWAPPESASK